MSLVMDNELPLFPLDGSRRFDVVAVGTALVDLLSHASLERVADFGLGAGTMTLIDGSLASRLGGGLEVERAVSGGTVANTVAGIAALGGRPAYIGAVAEDDLGERFAADLDAVGVHGVLERFTPAQDEATGACYVVVTPDAQRTMATHLGVAGLLHGSFVAQSGLIADSRIVYFDGYLLDFPDSEAIVGAIQQEAAASGTLIAFGLADPFAVDRHRERMLGLLGAVDLLFCNEDEARALSGASDLDGALAYLADDRRVSVVTRGPLGAVVVTPHGRTDVAAVPVADVVDVTGAGDLFAAGVLYAAARGEGAGHAAALGATLAAEAISHLGARPEADLASLAAAEGLI